MSLMNHLIVVVGLLLGVYTMHASDSSPPRKLKVGVVQMAAGRTIAESRDKIVAGISNAAGREARVAVFPEGALRGIDGNQEQRVTQAVAAIRAAAQRAGLFVLLGGSTYSPRRKADANWMLVIDPNGREVFRYDKIHDNHRAAMPGVFYIDGIPCSAMICADRWLRGVEEIPIQAGAQISFELSCNMASEWVPEFGW